MVTPELISYITQQRAVGKQDEQIKSELLGGSWLIGDIEEAFSSLDKSSPISIAIKKNKNRKLFITGIIILGAMLFMLKPVYVYEGSIMNPAKGLIMTRYHNLFLVGKCMGNVDEEKPSVFISNVTKCPHYVRNKDYIIDLNKKLEFIPFSFIDIHKGYIRPIAIDTILRFREPGTGWVTKELDALKLIEIYSTNSNFDIDQSVFYKEVYTSNTPDFKIEIKKADSIPLPQNWIITFEGEGGIQKADSEFPAIAPEDGYKKEIELEHNVTYVARLRDGKHYMLLNIWAHNGDTELMIDAPNLYLFISPVEGRKLDFIAKDNFMYGVKEAGTYGSQYYNLKDRPDTFFQ